MREYRRKHRTNTYWLALLASTLTVGIPLAATPVTVRAQQQQQLTVQGTVRDDQGTPLAGVGIAVAGTVAQAVTDAEGRYRITVPAGAHQLVFSSIGYLTQTVEADRQQIDVVLLPSSQDLEEVVVVGYGSQTKKDLTGSVANVASKDFNAGLVGSAEQLINGKASGVQVMSNSGSPTAGSTIRIRGGASLSASNDPLIVLDGVPLENGGISGNGSNFMSLINPNDIESMTILKDASATAIYGSRASNGVVLITTKKGTTGTLRIGFSSVLSMQQQQKVADMLSPQRFEQVIQEQGTAAQQTLLGGQRTDWVGQVFQSAFGTDNNVSLSGSVTNAVPFRASVGFFDQQGTLRTDRTDRVTGALSLSPTFFDAHLTLNLNVKGALNNNRFANTDAIWSAVAFNPTQPVHSGSEAFGGFYESLDNAGVPATGANLNPVGLLEQETHKSRVGRSTGNLDIDYKFHFLPALKAHVTLGYDYAHGEGENRIPASAANAYTVGGSFNEYAQNTQNRLLTAYLNYTAPLENSSLEVTAGYDFQYWSAKSPSVIYFNEAGDVQSTAMASDQRHTLLSVYGRINYQYGGRYLVTATIRRDGTSRFSPENRWGTFPSLALAWRLSEEDFLSGSHTLSDLKLRASYGVTGQQDGIGNYGYLSIYNRGDDFAQYRFGESFYRVLRPSVYVYDLRWETTRAFNYGIDFGLWGNRITGAVEYYTRKTHDLLANVSVPAGTNFDQTATTNVGNIESRGFEFQVNATPISRETLTWEVGFNATQQHTRVTNLSMVEDDKSVGSYVGPWVSGRGIQILTTGYEPNMFYVYKQVYDEQGKPLENVYADLNGDGIINESDLYRYESPAAEWFLGFNTQLTYKRWTVGTTLRANVGNYVFNNTKMDLGAWETLQYVPFALNNLHSDFLNTGFRARQYYSDYYVENASFLRMENITLGYDVGRIAGSARLRLGAIVQNVFVQSKYTGNDPEMPNGFDSTFYPRPRTYSLSVNLQF
ncbi:SusC/RagA family TonB-linked outer membrane protein [Parapedobacter defluvii]|uniref:SusC/RagA family TonB-linked outer membrane protein n=1 Tax=Parapedobacter defluvii TaxID=2045106 RepID=A0ABQ1M5R5_9SPHI|nr:SusC/RagA family TonB-linked outer membrane protein [Parapedobacter defluvii]GGC34881.1 SusC/RagA family TonB-linked outer membrane protein [Parapedobacter defluvii]